MSEMHEERSEVSLNRYGPAAGLLGIGGLVVLGGAFSGNVQAWQAYLFGYIVWLSLSLGCLGLLLLMHMLNASWGLPVLRVMEAGASRKNLGLLALMFLPLLYTVLTGNGVLYPWANPATMHADKILEAKQAYLNPVFFTIRAVIYFLFWFLMSSALRSSTLRQDQSKDKIEQGKRASWAAPGTVFFVLSVTFAFTDWVMSLEPHWSSTIYGAWWVVGMALLGLAFITMIATINKYKAPYAGLVTPNWTRDMGNLLLTFTMLWGYTSLSQYLIIWSGNLPEYISYYVHRSEGGWNAIGMANLLGQFFIPFFCLLSPRNKAQAGLLIKVCGFILAMRLLDMYYVVMPSMRGNPMFTFWDVLAVVGIGGLWTFAFSSAIGKAPLLPDYDPRLWEAAHAH